MYGKERVGVWASSTITSDSNGTISNTFSDQAINGNITRVQMLSSDVGADGSLIVRESGTNHQVLFSNGVSGSTSWFPRFPIHESDGSIPTGSADLWTTFPVNGDLLIQGSGLGDTKSFQVFVYYE